MLKEKFENLCIKLVNIFLITSAIGLGVSLFFLSPNINKNKINNIKYKTELVECITNAKTIKEENLSL